MKKIAALVGAGALVLALVVPAMAKGKKDSEVKIENENTTVVTTVTTRANTGGNEVHGMCVRGGKIVSGEATAGSFVSSDVNSSEVGCKGCGGKVEIKNKNTTAVTGVTTRANTGNNEMGGKYVSGGTIRTGDASAYSTVYSLVNYSVVGE